MARKSRKNLPVAMGDPVDSLMAQTAGKLNFEVTSYHAAIYARLSCETEANRERDTVETQIAYLRNFIDRQEDMELADVYADVSFSGTNFERPEFERMMQDIRAGKIDTVITKDLSRLGRNYIDSGTYIERIFPLFHVRYIAVNDDFDTNREGTDLTMPLKNIINEWYVRDLSNKMHASYQTMWKNGAYIYGRPLYGYKKDAVAKKLAVDGKTAPVVKRIFEMYLKGMTYSEIARALQQEGIVSPPKYRYLEQGNEEKAQTARDWYHLHIKTILTNQHYAGDSVHATREGGFNNPDKDRRVSEEHWLIIPNTHEPLSAEICSQKCRKKSKGRCKIFIPAMRRWNMRKHRKISFWGNVSVHAAGKTSVLSAATAGVITFITGALLPHSTGI